MCLSVCLAAFTAYIAAAPCAQGRTLAFVCPSWKKENIQRRFLQGGKETTKRPQRFAMESFFSTLLLMRVAHVSLSFASGESLRESQHSESHPEFLFLCCWVFFCCSVSCSQPTSGRSLLSFCPGLLPPLCHRAGPSAARTHHCWHHLHSSKQQQNNNRLIFLLFLCCISASSSSYPLRLHALCNFPSVRLRACMDEGVCACEGGQGCAGAHTDQPV